MYPPQPRRQSSFAQQHAANSAQTANSVQRLYLTDAASTSFQIWSPNFQKGLTVVRPMLAPERAPDGSLVFSQYRYSSSPSQFGEWIRSYIAFRSAGNPQVSFLACNPNAPTENQAQESPAGLLYAKIKKAVHDGADQQGWAAALEGGQNRGAILPKLKQVFFFYATIHEYGDKDLKSPIGMSLSEKPVLFELTQDAGEKTVALLNELNPRNPAFPDDDWQNVMKYGNVPGFGPGEGKYITFFNLASGDPRKARSAAGGAAAWDQAAMMAQGNNSRERKEIGYGVTIDDMHCGRTADFSGIKDQWLSRLKPLDEILQVLPFEQQAEQLVQRFPASMLKYAWPPTAPWINDMVRSRLANATAVGGMMAMPQQPAAPAGWGQPAAPAQQGWGQPTAPAAAGGWGQPAAAAPVGPTQAPQAASQGGEPNVVAAVSGWGPEAVNAPPSGATQDAGVVDGWGQPSTSAGPVAAAAPTVQNWGQPAAPAAPAPAVQGWGQPAPAHPALQVAANPNLAAPWEGQPANQQILQPAVQPGQDPLMAGLASGATFNTPPATAAIQQPANQFATAPAAPATAAATPTIPGGDDPESAAARNSRAKGLLARLNPAAGG